MIPLFATESVYPDGAIFGPSDKQPTSPYRFRLWRDLGNAADTCIWIMLNPSTADASVDDPTIRRCVRFSRAWGHGRIDVVNLFALRSTDPLALFAHVAPVSPAKCPGENDRHIALACEGARRIVFAWGNHGAFRERGRAVAALVAELADAGRCPRPQALRITGAGQPAHPLYLPASSEPIDLPGGPS